MPKKAPIHSDKCFSAGCRRRIRTLTNRVRVCFPVFYHPHNSSIMLVYNAKHPLSSLNCAVFVCYTPILPQFDFYIKTPPHHHCDHPHRNGNRGIRPSKSGRNLNCLNYIMFCRKRQLPIVRQISTFFTNIKNPPAAETTEGRGMMYTLMAAMYSCILSDMFGFCQSPYRPARSFTVTMRQKSSETLISPLPVPCRKPLSISFCTLAR